jgi:hypothetical protein
LDTKAAIAVVVVERVDEVVVLRGEEPQGRGIAFEDRGHRLRRRAALAVDSEHHEGTVPELLPEFAFDVGVVGHGLSPFWACPVNGGAEGGFRVRAAERPPPRPGHKSGCCWTAKS